MENLAVVNYDTNNLYLAPYDWRLSYYNLEERDGYFSRLKTTIEGLKYVSLHSVWSSLFLTYIQTKAKEKSCGCCALHGINCMSLDLDASLPRNFHFILVGATGRFLCQGNMEVWPSPLNSSICKSLCSAQILKKIWLHFFQQLQMGWISRTWSRRHGLGRSKNNATRNPICSLK